MQLRRKPAVGGDTSSHVSDTHFLSFYRMSDVEVKVEKEEELKVSKVVKRRGAGGGEGVAWCWSIRIR